MSSISGALGALVSVTLPLAGTAMGLALEAFDCVIRMFAALVQPGGVLSAEIDTLNDVTWIGTPFGLVNVSRRGRRTPGARCPAPPVIVKLAPPAWAVAIPSPVAAGV